MVRSSHGPAFTGGGAAVCRIGAAGHASGTQAEGGTRAAAGCPGGVWAAFFGHRVVHPAGGWDEPVGDVRRSDRYVRSAAASTAGRGGVSAGAVLRGGERTPVVGALELRGAGSGSH